MSVVYKVRQQTSTNRLIILFSGSVYFFNNGFEFFYFLRLAYRPSGAVRPAALAARLLLLRAAALLLFLLLLGRTWTRRTEYLRRSRTAAAVLWFVGGRASTS